MTEILIGLGGHLRSGKDALADYLADKHDFVKMGMSDMLNEALLTLNPWVPIDRPVGDLLPMGVLRYRAIHDAIGYVEAKKIPEVRRLLQVLGTEVGRERIDPEVWVKIAEKKILDHLSAGRSVVITAMRFPNELEMMNRLGGTTAWIDRPGEAHKVTEGITGHASEGSVSREDFQLGIVNDGTLEDLYGQAEALLDMSHGKMIPTALPYDR